jgi:hypothetical protein
MKSHIAMKSTVADDRAPLEIRMKYVEDFQQIAKKAETGGYRELASLLLVVAMFAVDASARRAATRIAPLGNGDF